MPSQPSDPYRAIAPVAVEWREHATAWQTKRLEAIVDGCRAVIEERGKGARAYWRYDVSRLSTMVSGSATSPAEARAACEQAARVLVSMEWPHAFGDGRTE